MFGPTASGYAQPFYPRFRLSLTDLLVLFDCPQSAGRHLAAADSLEILAIVTYLVAQSRRRMGA
jgi:hypothetical protein